MLSKGLDMITLIGKSFENMGNNSRYYVVWKGRIPGVYDNLEDAMAQV